MAVESGFEAVTCLRRSPVATEADTSDASRRTRLAAERTLLAWWRTGLGALAVGIGVGRLVPELSGADTVWPYSLLGLVYCGLGIALLLFGSQRFRAVERALAGGGYAPLHPRAVVTLSMVAFVLGVATGALVLVG